MQPDKFIRPEYAANFRCIGSACEDTCCQDWAVPVDKAAFEKYRTLPAGPMRALLNENVVRNAANSTPATFAIIKMASTGLCPMLSESGLCGVQQVHGEESLCHVCATYPRIEHSFQGVSETALTLSCPQAARVVLLNPKLLAPRKAGAEKLAWNGTSQISAPLLPYFWPIREFALTLMQNRAYPLWQRLFLLGIFSRRFDALPLADLPRVFPGFLRDFSGAVNSGSLRPALDSLPADNAMQLDTVLQLAGLLLHRSIVKKRFVDCIQAFTKGIGNGPGATLETITAQFSEAHDRYYEPFFERHPHILENYLINTIFRCQFPFGKDGMLPGAKPSMGKEFALLTTQFALTKGLLIGVSGCHREEFTTEHVIHTFQAAAKHFEHHPEFLNLAHNLLVETRMDGARGLTILLRNGKASVPRPPNPGTFVPGLPKAEGASMPIPPLPNPGHRPEA